MKYSDLPPIRYPERDHGSRERQDAYLVALAAGASIGEAARAAGVRGDSVPYWRVRYPGFREREAEILEDRELAKDVRRRRLCVCGVEFVAQREDQVFCSRSCATRETKTAYWPELDTAVLDALAEFGPLTRRDLVVALKVKLGSIRSVLARLERRGLIVRVGAARGLYAKWALPG